jgi:HSP20 family protein
MVEMSLKPNPMKPNYYVLDEIHQFSSEPAHWRVTIRSHVWRPPTDVFETEDSIIVRVEIAGMRESDFVISLDGRYLSIRGIRADMPERRAYYQMEIRFGEFSTEMELPYPVVPERIEAVYDNGFLRIVMPKDRPRHIPIQE